jgi:multidrug efflux system membrane fusion protein
MSENNHHKPTPLASRRRAFVLPGSLLVLAITAVGFYFQQSSAAPDGKFGTADGRRGREDYDAPAAVAIETARKSDFSVYLNGLGTVTALRTVTLRPRVDGELVRVAFSEGQMVKEGELLAEIDPRPFQIQLQQVEGQLLRDEALLKNAEIDHDRYQTLLAQDSISAQQTVTQQAQVKQYQGTVEMDKAQVNNAKLQLGYARLTSPISGRVGLRQIDQGNIVHANDTNGLVVITQLQPISVVFTLPEDKVQPVVQRWRTNEPVAVVAYDRAGKTKLAEGKLLAIDNQIDPTTGTLKLKAQFDNTESTLFANQFVNVKMHLETLPDATLVSSAAIQHDTQGPFVYVIDKDKKAQLRRITLGPTDADKVVVLSNLAANETVVVEGTDRLHEGSQVDIAQKDGQTVAANPDTLAKPEAKFRKQDRRS